MPTAQVTQDQFAQYDPKYGLTEEQFNQQIAARNTLSNPDLVTYNPEAVSPQTQAAQTPSGGVGSTYTENVPQTSRYDELKAIADAGNLNPAQRTEWDQLRQQANQANQDILREAEENYNQRMAFLNELQGGLEGNYNSLVGDIGNLFGSQRNMAESGREQSNRDIALAGKESKQGRENVITQARRALQESILGGNQRFGRGSDLGRALGEYATTGFQRASASAYDTYQNTAAKLANAKIKIEQDFNNAIADINARESAQKNEAYRKFQDALMQINQARSDAATDKSNLRIQAIQELKDDLMSISLNSEALASQAQASAAGSLSNLESVLDGANANIGNITDTTANAYEGVETQPVAAQETAQETDGNIFSGIRSAFRKPTRDDFISSLYKAPIQAGADFVGPIPGSIASLAL